MSVQKPLVVSCLGGPGSGKTTLAHYLLPLLKADGHKAYLVPDLAAQQVMAGNVHGIMDGLSRIAEINEWTERAERAGQTIILVENPMIQSFMYLPDDLFYRDELQSMIHKIQDQRPYLNLMMARDPSYFYDAASRHVDLDGAKAIDVKIREHCDQHGIDYVKVSDLAAFNPQDPMVQARAVVRLINETVARLDLESVLEEPAQAQVLRSPRVG